MIWTHCIILCYHLPKLEKWPAVQIKVYVMHLRKCASHALSQCIFQFSNYFSHFLYFDHSKSQLFKEYIVYFYFDYYAIMPKNYILQSMVYNSRTHNVSWLCPFEKLLCLIIHPTFPNVFNKFLSTLGFKLMVCYKLPTILAKSSNPAILDGSNLINLAVKK